MERSPVLLACVFGLAACGNVRPIRRPADDVYVHVIRRHSPSADDCPIHVIRRNCSVVLDGNVVDTVCEDAPPAELEVAQIHVCYREGWPSELRRAACRAGADTLLPTMSMTDACVEEDLDQLTGTSLGVFEAYRLRGAMLPHAK